ncbi:hypothetical protein NDI85_01360 [Halomicroarcula sp. S1AR25-4]|uniref:hypothetical protein n=1 Tax=Haloarcula sp. S1AR25-4 TaxID=2950538 RepID=UPI002876AC8D|nr:hypothetical protein [Halomicroarcula sp. S1AR25-4]MDS0276450.1 hypothetical protein [Halomicroarcula sp. S1AR25-4]
MKSHIVIILVLSSIAFAGVASAQQATSTPTTTPSNSTVSAPSGAPDAELVVDSDVVVTSYRYEDGEMIIKFWSSEFKSISVAPRADSSESGTVTARAFVLDEDTITTVRIASPGGVSFWTAESMEQNNQWHYLRKPSTFLITGPWSGSDVRDAGLGGALGVMIAVLYEAVSAKIGASQRGERLA